MIRQTVMGVMSAMHEEMHALIPLLDDHQSLTHNGREFHRGTLDGHDVIVVRAGIGKVAAAITASMLIDRFEVDAILMTGLAGGLGRSVHVGDVVIAETLVQHDMDARPLFPRFEVPLSGRSHFAADDHFSAIMFQEAGKQSDTLARLMGRQCSPHVHHGLVLSGDTFIASHAQRDALLANFPNALAVEMEGAAVAQVCHDADVPFAIVRVVSDSANDSASGDFQSFLQDAGALAAALVRHGLRAWMAAMPFSPTSPTKT